MTEKVSRLLPKVKELISEGRLREALSICETILLQDEDNINALLMSSKCLMDLDKPPNEILQFLNKVIILKPKHPTALQAFRKFYQKYLDFREDAVRFYYQLNESNELSPVDVEVISQQLTKISLSPDAEKLVIECLLTQINTKSNDVCLRNFCDIAVKEYILYQNKLLFEKLVDKLSLFDSIEDSESVFYVRNMTTFVKAIIDDKCPEDIYSLMTELSLKNIFTLLLFARVLCDHYLMLECEENIKLAMEQLQKSDLYTQDTFLSVTMNIRFENLIHLGDIQDIDTFMCEVDTDKLSKYLKCQVFSLGYNIFSDVDNTWMEVSEDWCIEMKHYQQCFCRALMKEDIERDVVDIHEVLSAASLSSFEWYLWAKVLKSLSLLDKFHDVLLVASKCAKVYFKVYIELAEMCSENNNQKMAVTYLEKGLAVCFCQEMVEAFVDLNIKWENYEEPLKLFAHVDIDHCSNNLLLKFVGCLKNLNKITDAISVTQRVVRKCPKESEYWQLLGDLYLRRKNINHALKTYEKCVQLSGETRYLCVRVGNAFSLNYYDTMEGNEFTKSISYFDKSIALGITQEALEGKVSTLFIHAEVAFKQMMITSTIKDIDDILKMLTEFDELLKGTEFQMNMMGKVLLLSLMTSVENLIDITSVKNHFFRDLESMDVCELGKTCFKKAVEVNPSGVDSHFHLGLLELFDLNQRTLIVRRGQLSNNILYHKVESHFKKTLSLDKCHCDAWKYLGYLYLKHGDNSEKLTLDTQHCLSEAINLSCDEDKINDPETAFFLGLLYIRENWFDLAQEVFQKIKLDYPINPLGFIGMYLLSDKDHRVEDQPEIAKALICFVYQDEATNIHDSYNKLNMSIVSLFAENMGFLVHSDDDTMLFNGQIEPCHLVIAFKAALNVAWTKYLCYSSTGCSLLKEEEEELKEFGSFLGMIELMSGSYEYGRTLLLKSTFGTENQTFKKVNGLLEINSLWETKQSEALTEQNEALAERIMAIGKLMNLKLQDKNMEFNQSSYFIKEVDEMLISIILDNLSFSRLTSFSYKYVNTLILAIPSLCDHRLSTEAEVSILLALGSFIINLSNTSLVASFLQTLSQSYANLIDNDDRLSRVISRLKLFEYDASDVLRYLNAQCLKQPYEMNRWLNLLEFGLEYSEQLNTTVTLQKLFFMTYRPWCMAPLDFERYSRILHKFSHLITPAAIHCHRLIFLKTMRLFPSVCLPIFKKVYILG